VIFDDILKLVDDISTQDVEYGNKLKAIAPKLRLLGTSPSLIPAISQGLKKLGKTTTVMRHKLESLKMKAAAAKRHTEQAKKPDIGAIKSALQVQLHVVKLANKQADFIISQFDSIGKK
jgi:hypothetical protein